MLQTRPDPCINFIIIQKTRPEQPQTELGQLVDPALRVVLGSGLHQPILSEPECGLGSGACDGIGAAQAQILAWVLHGREGQAAPEEDSGELHLPRRHVPLVDRVSPRHRLVGPRQQREVIARSSGEFLAAGSFSPVRFGGFNLEFLC
ncbi:hypothetical protein TIFTF001_019238 [Ficus carica]|uniref:Uncharacterized protein n=1 Tax=Ficus carica TaxID=3494 RepID=A0AA88AQ28_FICCA|nr:hypothetical protein TIFTF001_019238 [Ficus carica]